MIEEKLFEALERMELQQIVIWWDLLIIFFWIISLEIIILGITFSKIFLILYGLVSVIITTITVQILESFDKRRIKRFYGNTREILKRESC